MKEQKKEKSFLKNVIFILLLGLFFAGLNSFFQPAWFSWNNYDTFHGFYSEPENTIETIFLGSSAAVNGVDPMELYRRRGLSCYNLGSEQQPLMVSYYWMQEAFRRNPRSLKTVFLDVSELRKGSQPEFYQKGIDPMHFSMVKYNAVKDYTGGKAEDIVSHLVPLFSYHSRWNSLNRSDFSKYSYKVRKWTRGYNFKAAKNNLNEYNYDEIPVPGYYPIREEGETDLYEESLVYLGKIVDFSRDHKLKVVLYKSPSNHWPDRIHCAVESLADRLGLEFLDFNYEPLADRIRLNMALDLSDFDHLNYSGAWKMTDYLGQYLVDQCHGTDVRGKSGYEHLDKELTDYKKNVDDVITLKRCKDPAKYLSFAMKRKNYTVLIAAMDEASRALTDSQREAFDDMGLKELANLSFRDSYIGVIRGGKVVCENIKKDNDLLEDRSPLVLDSSFEDGKRYILTSGGAGMGNIASCMISESENPEVFPGLRGLNILVYNNKSGKILDSTVFDTFSSPERIAEDLRKELRSALKEDQDFRMLAPELKKLYLYNLRLDYEKEKKQLEADYGQAGFLRWLDHYKDREDCVLFLAVKDEASSGLKKIRGRLREYGLDDLADLKYHDSFLAVIREGEVLTQKKGKGKKPLSVNGVITTEEGFAASYRVISGGFNSGNVASFMINENQYAKNGRGINLLVWDLKHAIPVASVCFDSHMVKQKKGRKK